MFIIASYETNNDIVGGGGLGFGGGGIAMVLVVLVVLWTLFRDGGHKDGYDHGPRGYGDGCGPCVRPSFLDESNWEQESHLDKELCKVDRDVIEQGCKDREAIHCDGDKTRQYIAHLQERADDKAYSQLAMQNAQKDNYIQTLQLKSDFDCKFDKVLGAIGKIECEIPHRPPFYACGGEPTIYDYPPRNYGNDYPKRGRCNDCNDGYGYGVA